jgi:ribulose bisphosphate carboxylase small subunit
LDITKYTKSQQLEYINGNGHHIEGTAQFTEDLSGSEFSNELTKLLKKKQSENAFAEIHQVIKYSSRFDFIVIFNIYN